MIDSGADWCVFPKIVAEMLDLDFATGKPWPITGACGRKGCTNGFFHDVKVTILEKAIPCQAVFIDCEHGVDEYLPMLGRNGIFKFNTIKFEPDSFTVLEL